jgi:hypothetical protein
VGEGDAEGVKAGEDEGLYGESGARLLLLVWLGSRWRLWILGR